MRWPKLYSSDVVAPDEEEGGKAMCCAVLDEREDIEIVRRYGTFNIVTLEAIRVCWPRSKD